MAKETIERRASDNVYLHKDFHGALSAGLIYLEERYGPSAVRDYLAQFAGAFYGELKQAINERGLSALREHLERTYAIEGGEIEITGDDDGLLLTVNRCPAVTHMRQHNYEVAPLFYETSKTVYAEICNGTPFVSEWVSYDEQTGRTAVRFARRAQ